MVWFGIVDIMKVQLWIGKRCVKNNETIYGWVEGWCAWFELRDIDLVKCELIRTKFENGLAIKISG